MPLFTPSYDMGWLWRIKSSLGDMATFPSSHLSTKIVWDLGHFSVHHVKWDSCGGLNAA